METTKILLPRGKKLIDAGIWLDTNLPNPPLPEPQRWSIVNTMEDQVEFAEEYDAIFFTLMWLG
jgi:hypothetical protein